MRRPYTMALSLSKNAILCGVIDYYCLVCEVRMHTDEQTSKHVVCPTHHNNLLKTSYELIEDGIRKIKLWYFCEFCNLAVKTKAKLKLHIVQPKHVTNKNSQYLRRQSPSTVIVFEKVVIDEKSWQGICDGTCVICNCEIENESEHMKDFMHNINLLQGVIEYSNDNIYRLVDTSLFQCLICNRMEFLPVIDHFDSPEHKSAYEKCEQRLAEIVAEHKNNLDNSETTTQLAHSMKTEDNSRKTPLNNKEILPENKREPAVQVEDKLTESKLKGTDVEKSSSITKEEEKKNSCEIKKTTKHIQDLETTFNSNNKTLDIKLREQKICKMLNTKNYITLDDKGSNWCILCDWVMDRYNIDKHLNGVHHRNILKRHEARLNKMYTSVEKVSVPVEKKDKEVKLEESKANDSMLELVTNDLSRIKGCIDTFQNTIDINLEKKSATCKKCTMNIDFKFKLLKEHVCDHNSKKAESISRNKKHSKGNNSIIADEEALENRNKILDNLQKFQNSNISISFETDTITCKKCGINIAFNYEIIEKHISEHNPIKFDSDNESGPKQLDPKTPSKEALQYAKDNNLHKQGEKNVFCKLCEMQVPLSLINMTEHIEGSNHRLLIEKMKEKKIETTNVKSFIRGIIKVEDELHYDFIINSQLVINVFSFLCLIRIPEFNMNKCVCCDLYLNSVELGGHIQSHEHGSLIAEMSIVILDGEFIRKLPSNNFHCGLCNCVVKNWSQMENHLESISHREAKTSASWRLELHTSRIGSDIARQTTLQRFPLNFFNNIF